jgi:hypothetical protein
VPPHRSVAPPRLGRASPPHHANVHLLHGPRLFLLGSSSGDSDNGSGEPAGNCCSHTDGSSCRCIPPSFLFPLFSIVRYT